jgi:uroporphyrin-III C-methyltransferase
MGIHNLGKIIPQLMVGGLSAETPIALIRWGTCSEQEQLIGTLVTILQQIKDTSFTAPAIAVIGKVVNFKSQLLANSVGY